MYSRILVPLDGTPFAEGALAHALTLANGNGAEIILVKAAQDSLAAVPEARIHASSRQVYAQAIRAMAYLRKVAEEVRRDGRKVLCDVEEGDPASAILSCARKQNVDVIIMGTHRRNGLSRMLQGSVAETVAMASRRPVLLVKVGAAGRQEVGEPGRLDAAESARPEMAEAA